jgi:hypothetical protein
MLRKICLIRSSETSVPTRTTWQHIPEDDILQSDASLSSCRNGFNTWVVYIQILVNTVVVLRQISSKDFSFSLPIIISFFCIYIQPPLECMKILIKQKIITIPIICWGFTLELALGWTRNKELIFSFKQNTIFRFLINIHFYSYRVLEEVHGIFKNNSFPNNYKLYINCRPRARFGSQV